MRVLCGVLFAIAVILGIVILIVVLYDKRKKAESKPEMTTESPDTAENISAVLDALVPDVRQVGKKESFLGNVTVSEDYRADGTNNDKEVDNDFLLGTELTDQNGTVFSPVCVVSASLDSMGTNTEKREFSNADDIENAEFSELKVLVKDGKMRYIVIKYSKSFQAKLIQSADETKRYYSELKNCFLSYGVKSRMSWKWESFRHGRKTLAKFRLRGKTLSLALALKPEEYTDTKYHVENIADIVCYEDTPCLYRIKNESRLRYARDLIAKVMKYNGVEENPPAETIDYVAKFPYETTEVLIERKLIKVLTDEDAQSGTVFKPHDIRTSVTAQEVDNILKNEVAAALIEKSDGVTDKSRTGIINIDTLSHYFCDGESVNLDEIKRRIPNFNKTTYIKVLARGTLDKILTVEADDFSIQAVKMIVLIGGKVIKT